MPTTDLLRTFGLSRNPFTDRTAEKTNHNDTSLYIHSDLRGLRPSDTTYIFFGRRGSGKTTIRLLLEEAYRSYNEQAVASGTSKGHFIVDITKPGHMTACLRTYMETTGGCARDSSRGAAGRGGDGQATARRRRRRMPMDGGALHRFHALQKPC